VDGRFQLLLERLTNSGIKPAWPGGCSGVVVNRLNGDVPLKVVGCGLWRSADQCKTWQRIDQDTVTGRDETGLGHQRGPEAPTRMASFSLDGSRAGRPTGTPGDALPVWAATGISLGRLGRAEPRTIIAAKHETNPPGEVYVTTDAGMIGSKSL